MTHDQRDDPMDGRADDGRLDDALLEAARAYHAPPAATPRDAMWERIRVARETSAPAAPAPAPPAIDALWYGARRVRRRPAWAMPLAAALLLAAGITIGRISTGNRSTASSTTPVALGPSKPALQAPGTAAPSTGQGAEGRAATAQAPTGAASSHAGTGDLQPPAPDSRSAALAYRLAAAEHLAMTETLLATVSADARADRADGSVAAWARDLLGTTRVLLDSPAARDPQLARLLEDLELVLAQLAQLPTARGAAAATEELQAIDRAVRRRGVLTRVRAAIPPGALSAGT